MSAVYMREGGNRGEFVTAVFQRLEVTRKYANKRVLIKPNIVSHEPYPTTTHPAVLETCLQLLLPAASKIIVADGSAWDAGDSKRIIENHPLKRSCEKLGVIIDDLLADGASKIRTQSGELEVSRMAFEYDFILSLPVLKSHSICGLTGALKNHIGFLSVAEKRRLHYSRNVHKVIAELNSIIKPDLYIVDAVETLINTNEIRHGGRPHALGYMLAGTDPVSLDVLGFELLKKIEPKLKNKNYGDIPHLRQAIESGIGEPVYEVVEF